MATMIKEATEPQTPSRGLKFRCELKGCWAHWVTSRILDLLGGTEVKLCRVHSIAWDALKARQAEECEQFLAGEEVRDD